MPATSDVAKNGKQPVAPKKLTIYDDPDLFTCGEAAIEVGRQQTHTADQTRQLENAMRAAIFAGELGNYDYRTGLLIVPPFSLATPLAVRMADVEDWLNSPSYKARLRATTAEQTHAMPVTVVDNLTHSETREVRQARRYQMCVDAGLTMPKTDYDAMPRGIDKVAALEKITRQAFTEDVKAHIRRAFMN
jgi:hypothetical protein